MTPRQTLDAWLNLLNRTARELDLLAPDLVIVYFPQGKGGPSVRLEGLDEVMAWAWRGPDGRFRYEATEPVACAAAPSLPPGDEAFAARYTVALADPAWSNHGDWTIHTVGDHIVGVLHEPDALPEDCCVAP